MKTIIVEAKGKKLTGAVLDEREVTAPRKSEVNQTIAQGVDELISILSGEVEDPTKKKCSRCIKMGRVPYHDINDFSLLKNGKRHSQCKVCRVELANEWCEKRKEHRKKYHAEYYKKNPKEKPLPKGFNVLMKNYQNPTVVEDKVDASKALIIGYTDAEDVKET